MQEPDAPASPTDLDALFVGRYSIVRALAPGGMAEVYLAVDLRHDRKVVLKVLRPKWTESLASQRFLREISIAAKLSHPNIVPLYDSGDLGGCLFYVMPFIEGASLRQRLRDDRALTIEEALQITFQIADALSYAHGRGIVHRDIKPDNILFESGHALVSDFGIAKAIQAAAGDTLTTGQVVVGTLAYMSPEQASATDKIDQRSDLYSLALVLYEMLAGEIPFTMVTPEVMFARKALGEYRPLRATRKDVPAYLDKVIARALRPEPSERFESIAAFVSALRSANEVESKRAMRYRIWALASGATVVLAVIAVASMRANSGGTLAPPELGRVVVAPLENRTGVSSLDVVGLMAGDWITEGLQKTGILEVVPTPTALQASKYVGGDARSDRPTEPLRALAAETGARTVVGGAFYRRGDSLLFRVSVADRNGDRLVVTLTDVVAPVSDPLPGIEELRNRLMGWLAMQSDDRIRDPIRGDDRPPMYAAYREFSNGMNHYIAVENALALPSFLNAFRIDSSFTVSLLYASITLTNVGQWARADSLLQIVDRRREQLSPYDRAWLDYRLAFVHGNHEEALAAIREAARQAPLSKAAYNHAVEAFLSGHVTEAKNALEALPSDRGPMRGFSPYWDIYGAVLHSLGLYDQEYDVAVSARKAYPTRLTRYTPLVRAEAARGDITGLAATLAQAKELPTDPLGWDYGHTLSEVGEELRAHGHPVEAAAYLEELRRWLTKDRGPNTRSRLVRTLYWQGKLRDARNELNALRLTDPGNPEYLGISGLLDSRMGQGAAARAVMDTLAQRHVPYEFGLPSLYRARISATLGDRDAAVALLKQSFEEGRSYELSLHRDIDFESLRGYPPFEALKRGKN